MREKKRVVVTGIGAITALGRSVAEMWTNIAAGASGVRSIDIDSLSVPLGARPDYSALTRFDGMDVCSGLALLAAEEAVKDSGLAEEALREMDVVFGTSKGGIRSFESASRQFFTNAETALSQPFLNEFTTNASCDHIAAHLGCEGLRLNFVSACATGTHSIIMAARRIAEGKSRVVLTGSSEASLTTMITASFDKMGVLSHTADQPAAAIKPYDARRDGFAIGEGGGAMVLESLESALARGARILARVKGWAFGSEAYHLSAMDLSGESVASAIRRALEMADLSACDLDYINSHGTATQQNDVVETRAFKLALGKHAYGIPISSTKPMTGHLLGATGSVEAIITVLASQNNFVPPTLNLDEPDPECDLDYTPKVGIRRNIQNALTLNYGFGGQIGAIIFGKYQGE